jgi:hypothetical protein
MASSSSSLSPRSRCSFGTSSSTSPPCRKRHLQLLQFCLAMVFYPEYPSSTSSPTMFPSPAHLGEQPSSSSPKSPAPPLFRLRAGARHDRCYAKHVLAVHASASCTHHSSPARLLLLAFSPRTHTMLHLCATRAAQGLFCWSPLPISLFTSPRSPVVCSVSSGSTVHRVAPTLGQNVDLGCFKSPHASL